MTDPTDLKIYGLIPLKSQSTRFPDKNFSEFCETTLLNNTLEKLQKARVDNIFISTDNPPRVIAHLNFIGLKEPPKRSIFAQNIYYKKGLINDGAIHIIIRPKELATPEATQDAVVKDFIDQLDITDNYIIALCQVTSPNWSPHRITYAIHRLNRFNKTVISVSDDFKPNGCFYLFTKEMFLEYQSIYHHDNGIYLIKLPFNESTDIDYPYQLRIAEAISRGDYDD